MKIFKDFALIIGMLAGILGFLLLDALHLPAVVRGGIVKSVNFLQPFLIFMMLFLTFCKISFSELKLRGWHLWLILIQGGLFTILGIIILILPPTGWNILIEGAMICLICPTATASAVVTRKLGGNAESITMYLVVINILNALLVPILVPMVHPAAGVSVITAGVKILSKVFPILLLPLVAAYILKVAAPKVRTKLASHPDLPFYLWIVALALALGVTTHSVVRTNVDISIQLGLVGISLITCIAQFAIGRKIGVRYGDTITAGQACGQKNTAFAIWMGYTFFTPITSLAGGFYSIWHNLFNSYQLYRKAHGNPKEDLPPKANHS